MGVFDNLLERLAERIGQHVQGYTPSQAFRDRWDKGDGYSVEAEISEALADLVLMFSTAPVSGESERAKWLDGLTTEYLRDYAKTVVASAFLSGDCIVVPSWNGRNMQNVVVPSEDFEVTGCYGREITAAAYVVDRKERNGEQFRLMQAVELVPYESAGGTAYANRYRMFAARNDSLDGASIDMFPEWRERYPEPEWYVPNVDRLLIGRMRSHAIDPRNVNSVKGVPICFGAGEAIKEIHYLLDQMHAEFGLSEKFIMADKRMFQREWHGNESHIVLPRGKERVIMALSGQGQPAGIEEWAPDIRHMAYLEAIDKQEQLVERAVGVSSGIISRPNDMNYQNVDNVRKSQQKTMGFVEAARRSAETMLEDLVYSWDVLANYYEINPMGEWELGFDWSDEYVESFADRQNAILAGEAIGAADAVDYRKFAFNESPETAAERVAQIRAAQASAPSLLTAV